MISRLRVSGSQSFRRLLSSQAATKTRPRQNPQDVAEYFHFTKAVVASRSCLGDNFAQLSLRFLEPSDPIDIDKARQQHTNYVSELKKFIPEIHIVPHDHRFPDQVFVEDPAVVLDGTAFIAPMKPPTRSGEVGPMRQVLEDLGLRIVEVSDPEAYLDGGDVIFTGREFLVGLSERTNAAGIESLAKAFPQWPVTGIKVAQPVLHLKSMCSIAGINLIAISESKSGNIAWKEIESQAQYKYERLGFPDDNGANCLFINGVVMYPPKEEYPESYKIWERLDCLKLPLANSELTKADGSLTCNSIRIN